KDKETASLKSRLDKAEGNSTEVFRLHGRVSKLEYVAAVRVEALTRVGAKNAELIWPDAQDKCIKEHATELDERIVVLDVDIDIEAKYLAAITDLENVPFHLLEDLVALKDSPIELLMASLTLEGGHGEED
ncbi:hypothetical protein Tco_1178626, partial [Tanacetum coccineum]